MSITTDIKEILRSDLTPYEKTLLIAIRTRQGTNEWCYPSQNTLAKDIGSNKAHVSRSMNHLRHLKWVEKEGRNFRYKVTNGATIDKTPKLPTAQPELPTAQQIVTNRATPSEVTIEVTEEVKDIWVEKPTKKRKQKRFIKPTLSQASEYFIERGAVDESDAWMDHFVTCGWKVGKKLAPMKDWQAAIRTWIRNDFNGVQNGETNKRTSARHQSIQQERQNFSYEESIQQGIDLIRSYEAQANNSGGDEGEDPAPSQDGHDPFGFLNSVRSKPKVDGIPGEYRVLGTGDESGDS